MRTTDVIVIGAGQAGLAMSHCLGRRGIDHVVLERGRIAERWRSERWDSLRLLTPNWQSRLPGFGYRGEDPDGYMAAREVADYLARYARSFDAPVYDETAVRAVRAHERGYRVVTDRGDWIGRKVVVATGQCDVPFVPPAARRLSQAIHQVTPSRYRNPGQLPPGGVLVVGASASGLQLAHELRLAGRQVMLAVGRHTRLPRRYRGRDIMWWLDRMGTLDRGFQEVFDLRAARREPSLQLVGTPQRRTLDLGVLREAGVRLVGSLVGAEGSRAHFADDLPTNMTAADARLERQLSRIDAFAARHAIPTPWGPVPATPLTAEPGVPSLDLARESIGSVLWATGFRRDYTWLQVPVLDRQGEIRHHGGVAAAPGLYVLGLAFLRRRKSTFIDGVGDDARELAEHVHAELSGRPSIAA